MDEPPCGKDTLSQAYGGQMICAHTTWRKLSFASLEVTDCGAS